MIDFALDQDQTMIRDMVRKFAQDKRQAGQTEIPRDELIELGLWDIQAPETLGGAQMDQCTMKLILEELARASASTALQVLYHNLALDLARDHVQTLFQNVYVSGSIVEQATLRAIGASDAQIALVCSDQGDASLLRLGDFDLSESTDGWMGLDGLSAWTLSMNKEVQEQAPSRFPVPESHRARRLHGLAAVALGVARAAQAEAISYATTRRQFGKPLSAFQASQFKIADIGTQIDAADVLTWQSARAIDEDRPHALAVASMAYLEAERAARLAADEGLQLHGGYGYTKEYFIEQCYRDAHTLAALARPITVAQVLGEQMVEAS